MPHHRSRPAGSLGLFLAGPLILAAAVTLPPAVAHQILSSPFTYGRDVLPIIQRRCGRCHREGGIAPMSLLRYSEARPWAAAIRAAVLEGKMPPWPAERGLAFVGEEQLSGREIDILVDWASGGASEGGKGEGEKGAAPRPPPPIAEALAARAPDLLLSMPRAEVLPAGIIERRVEVLLDPALERARTIGAFELRPSEPALLHDGWISIVPDGGDPEPLGSWTPLSSGAAYPAGAGRLLPRGSRLRLELHYRKGFQSRGRELADRSALALWLRPGEGERPASVVRAFRWSGAELPFDRSTRLVSILGRLPAGGKAVGEKEAALEILRADRPRSPLVPFATLRFRPDWPVDLRPLSPERLEAGSRLARPVRADRPTPELWLEIIE